MDLASDNGSGIAPQILAALTEANSGHVLSYGADALTSSITEKLREIFEAPEAEVRLVTSGTAANALSIALLTPPWGAVFCHADAHIQHDECGAPEFFSNGAKLIPVAGADGRIAPEALAAALEAFTGSLHAVQPSCLSLTTATEAGTVYTPEQIAELAGIAKSRGMGVHLDGARFANAVVASGASPADLSWRAGVDVLSLGGTKNGCMGVEAILLFDPARARELDLRRKRAGHLMSKHRFLAAQFAAYLEDGLWLRLAARANAAAAELVASLRTLPDVCFTHPVEANILFVTWPEGTAAQLQAAGAALHAWPLPDSREGARLVTSWNSEGSEVARFSGLLRSILG